LIMRGGDIRRRSLQSLREESRERPPYKKITECACKQGVSTETLINV
jgi:hypothetical protein